MSRPAKRVRIRRKDLRQPDEFATLTGTAVEWVQEHRALVIGGLTLVLGGGLVWLGVSYSRQVAQEAAGRQFAAAQAALDAGGHEAAAAGFETLAADAPGTSFGHLARLYQGHALARQGDAAGAAVAYAEYLAGSPATAYLRQEGLVGLAQAKEASGDAAGALAAYTEASEIAQGPFGAQAALGTARLHEAAGRLEEARRIYEEMARGVEAPTPDVAVILGAKVPEVLAARGADGQNVR